MRIHLLGQARSGTTYLYNVIRQHYVTKQHVDFGNEPFNSDFRDSSTFGEQLDLIAQTPRAIIKNHTLHLPQMPPEQLDRFKKLMDFTVVVWRPNIFEVTASLCVSVTKDQWYASQQDIKPIKIDPMMFKMFWKGFYWETLKLKNNYYNIKVDKWVRYDELTRNTKQDWINIGLCMTDPMAIIDFPIEFTNISPPKEEIILNYEDLRTLSIELSQQQEVNWFGKQDSLNIQENMIEDFTCS